MFQLQSTTFALWEVEALLWEFELCGRNEAGMYGHHAAQEMLQMHQGMWSVSDYPTDFQILVNICGWGKKVL